MFTKGQSFQFKASKVLSGPVTFNETRIIPLTRDGKPVLAGDIKQGQTITVNIKTGEIESAVPLHS